MLNTNKNVKTLSQSIPQKIEYKDEERRQPKLNVRINSGRSIAK